MTKQLYLLFVITFSIMSRAEDDGGTLITVTYRSNFNIFQ